MRVVTIHEAKTHWSRLVEQAANGETFVFAEAGKPLVKVSRLGVLRGACDVPDAFDGMGAQDIARSQWFCVAA